MKYDPLGDGISSVELLGHMGDCITVVNAARVSMAKESAWEDDGCECFAHGPDECVCGAWHGEKRQMSERDQRLLRYLARHGHWTPFAHPQVQLRIKMPIFVARQWYKHQIGFSRNEVSRRYVDDPPEFYVPTKWRKRAENVKQGSADEEIPGSKHYSRMVKRLYKDAAYRYEYMIANGIAPEMARMVLPQAMYTEFVETGSLAAYARLCKQRMDEHAQWEIRQYANAVDSIMQALFPYAWAAVMGDE